MKSELFAKILAVVAQVTELEPQKILSKTKTEDLVAARSLFVHQCVRFGIPPISIAEFMNRSKTKCITRSLEAYNSYYKTSYLFREMDNMIASMVPKDAASMPQ